jgi:hypothetical protein
LPVVISPTRRRNDNPAVIAEFDVICLVLLHWAESFDLLLLDTTPAIGVVSIIMWDAMLISRRQVCSLMPGP